MVTIKKNPNGDTRTAKPDVSFEEFQASNDMHIEDVKNVMSELSDRVYCAGVEHDFTKKTKERLFYRNFLATINNGVNFVNNEWYQYHIQQERHHLLANCPQDVDLIDVLEMISDCVCAGKSRSGEIRPVEISSEILELAFKNTVKLVDNMAKVE